MSKILSLFLLYLILCAVLHFSIKALYDEDVPNLKSNQKVLQKDEKIFVSIILCLFILRTLCHLFYIDISLISFAFEYSIEIASIIFISVLLYQTCTKKISSTSIRIFITLTIINILLLGKNELSHFQDKKGISRSQRAEMPKTPTRS